MLFVFPAADAGEAAPDRLELAAEPPVIPVTARAPGRRFIELPSLEYRFEVDAACAGSRTPRSLSISIADSRLSLSGGELETAGEFVLRVPARQLAPVAVDDFCVDTPAMNAAPQLTVPGVVSAQASLVCGDEDSSGIRYVVQPLAVTLACTVPAGSPGER